MMEGRVYILLDEIDYHIQKSLDLIHDLGILQLKANDEIKSHIKRLGGELMMIEAKIDEMQEKI